MKKFIFILPILVAFTVKAQTEDIGLNMPVPERSPEVFSHDHICRTYPTEGVCEVVIRCKSDVFPIQFIQNNVVLRTIPSIDSIPDGLAVIKNVKYKELPHGFYYQLDVKNSVGRTTLMIQRGE